MGSVTFWEGIGYGGNSRTIDIGDTTHPKILVYENPDKPIVIRSIKNYTNNEYIVALFYNYISYGLGQFVLLIESDLSDINKVWAYIIYSTVRPSFNSVMLLRKTTLPKNIVYNYVSINTYNSYNNENALDMTKELIENTENVQTQPTPQQQQTNLQFAPVTESGERDKYVECRNNREELIAKVHLKQMLYDQCQRSNKSNFDSINKIHAEQKSKLAKELQKLQQENNNLKTKGTTGNKNLMYSYFFVIVDLLMLFYILYKHNLFRMK